MPRFRHSWTVFALLCLFVAAAASAEDRGECNSNVASVRSVDFRGPDAVPANAYVGYEITVTVEKSDSTRPATLCYVVRDSDPWFKLVWLPDDVLGEGTIHLAAGESTATVPGSFSLLNRSGKITGSEWTPNTDTYSGEREADVYIEIIDASGATRSAVHTIRAQP